MADNGILSKVINVESYTLYDYLIDMDDEDDTEYTIMVLPFPFYFNSFTHEENIRVTRICYEMVCGYDAIDKWDAEVMLDEIRANLPSHLRFDISELGVTIPEYINAYVKHLQYICIIGWQIGLQAIVTEL